MERVKEKEEKEPFFFSLCWLVIFQKREGGKEIVTKNFDSICYGTEKWEFEIELSSRQIVLYTNDDTVSIWFDSSVNM